MSVKIAVTTRRLLPGRLNVVVLRPTGKSEPSARRTCASARATRLPSAIPRVIASCNSRERARSVSSTGWPGNEARRLGAKDLAAARIEVAEAAVAVDADDTGLNAAEDLVGFQSRLHQRGGQRPLVARGVGEAVAENGDECTDEGDHASLRPERGVGSRIGRQHRNADVASDRDRHGDESAPHGQQQRVHRYKRDVKRRDRCRGNHLRLELQQRGHYHHVDRGLKQHRARAGNAHRATDPPEEPCGRGEGDESDKRNGAGRGMESLVRCSEIAANGERDENHPGDENPGQQHPRTGNGESSEAPGRRGIQGRVDRELAAARVGHVEG